MDVLNTTSQTKLVVGPNEPGNAQLGGILHELRERTGLSRAEAAHKHNFTSEYLRLIERGKRVPARGTTRAMLKTYGIDCKLIDETEIIFETYVIEFTSRIQEARRKIPNSTRALPRDALLGQIVRYLINADDTTLRWIHAQLMIADSSRENPSL